MSELREMWRDTRLVVFTAVVTALYLWIRAFGYGRVMS